MTQYSKINIIYLLQKWIDSVPGQTFLNYAYSWGASIVILGTLFKLTHLPGANVMLYIGMGTEVLVFFISAFDRPFDKTAIGMDLPTHLEDEENEETKFDDSQLRSVGEVGNTPNSTLNT
ncbi:MAG: gliding motility protein GldL, partial [Prevotella sp.]|nr:gliding motility protein GldL [Prevotella sp.]